MITLGAAVGEVLGIDDTNFATEGDENLRVLKKRPLKKPRSPPPEGLLKEFKVVGEDTGVEYEILTIFFPSVESLLVSSRYSSFPPFFL